MGTYLCRRLKITRVVTNLILKVEVLGKGEVRYVIVFFWPYNVLLAEIRGGGLGAGVVAASG